jgi:hypothetical protein
MSKTGAFEASKEADVDDDDWFERKPVAEAEEDNDESRNVPKEQQNEGEPMIIVDMTALSTGEIHSKFDANAVNDPAAVKKLRLTIERDYDKYAKDASLLADRTVTPCGSSVWRPALANLRKEKVGHYFCPIFPPKK